MKLHRLPVAERKTYCNLEAFRGVGKTRRVRAALESLWENFTRDRPAAGEEASFYLFFLEFVREAAACENATFSRGVFGASEMVPPTLKASHLRWASEGATIVYLRVGFMQV